MTVQPFPKRTDWPQLCLCGDTGKPLPVLANALTALNNDPALRDAFAYDEMLRAPILVHKIGQPLMGNLPSPQLLTDKDVSDLQNWLQRGRTETHRSRASSRCGRKLRPRPFLSSSA